MTGNVQLNSVNRKLFELGEAIGLIWDRLGKNKNGVMFIHNKHTEASVGGWLADQLNGDVIRYTVDADCKGFPHRCQALLQCVQDNQLGEVEVLLSSFPEYPLERGGEGTGQVTDTEDTVIWQTPLPALSMHPKLELTEF